MKDKPKDPAAVALGEKRWRGVSKKKRTELTRAAVSERWSKTSPAEREAIGAKLAEARRKAKKKKAAS